MRSPRAAHGSRLKRHYQAGRYCGAHKGHEPQAMKWCCSTSRVPSVQLAQRRVAKRVKGGGHAIAAEVTGPQFYRSLANLLPPYRGIADAWFVNDNSSSSNRQLIALGFEDIETILAPDKWQRLKQRADSQQLTLPSEPEIRAAVGNAICEVRRTAESKSKTLAVTRKNSWSVPK